MYFSHQHGQKFDFLKSIQKKNQKYIKIISKV